MIAKDYLQESFNSTMVRLKVQIWGSWCIKKLSFNSTMVRLKVVGSHPNFNATKEFQFHNGSIKRMGYNIESHYLMLVSIPQWFD